MSSFERDPERGRATSAKLKALGAKRVLIKAAEQGYITQLACKMPECFCPEELGGACYFEPVTPELSDWMPTHEHFPLSKSEGGMETVDNAILAHRLCNRIDYSIRVGRSYASDLKRIENAREEAIRLNSTDLGASDEKRKLLLGLRDTARAVSLDNVEIVRRLYERWASGELATDRFGPDIEYSRIGAETPDLEGRWVGVGELVTAMREYLQAFADLRVDAVRITELRDGRVLVLTRQTARGKTSGVPIEHELGDLLTLRDGKIVRLCSYWDRSRALEAAGVSE